MHDECYLPFSFSTESEAKVSDFSDAKREKRLVCTQTRWILPKEVPFIFTKFAQKTTSHSEN